MSRDTGGSSPNAFGMEKETKQPIELDAKILRKYPNLQSLPEKVKSTVSAIYENLIAVEGYLGDVKSGRYTGDVEYHLSFVKEMLNKLKTANNPTLEKFVADHEVKLADVTAKSKEIIGVKKRDYSSKYR